MPFASGQDARADSAVGVDAFLAGGEVIGAPASEKASRAILVAIGMSSGHG